MVLLCLDVYRRLEESREQGGGGAVPSETDGCLASQ